MLLTPESGDHRAPELARRKVDRGDKAAPASIGHGLRPGLLELDQPHEEMLPDICRVRDRTGLLDELQQAAGSHHVGEVAAPGRVDPSRGAKDVLVDLIHPPAGHDAPELDFLAERH